MFEKSMLLKLAEEVREKTGVKIFTAIGVHPSRIGDFMSLMRRYPRWRGESTSLLNIG
jgi:predicted urease superfamily metal-dependent hydrolase